MKKFGYFVFIVFIIRTLFSFGFVLQYVGTEDVFYYLGDLTANIILLYYLQYSVKNVK